MAGASLKKLVDFIWGEPEEGQENYDEGMYNQEYDEEYETEEPETEWVEYVSHKTGKKKRKKRKNKPIDVVDNPGDEVGVNKGKGKIRFTNPNITDHRTFRLRNGEYKLFIESPEAYDKVYIQYYVGRDDEGKDTASILRYRMGSETVECLEKNKIGPISLVKGENEIIISFVNDESIAVVPVFTMEVTDEK